MMPLDTLPNSSGCLTEQRSATVVPVIGRLLAKMDNLYRAWQQRRNMQQDLDHIAKFSPYLLRDIGLNPEDVAHAKPKKPFVSNDTIGRPG